MGVLLGVWILNKCLQKKQLKAFGVTQIQVMNDNSIYTSGPSGIIKCNRIMQKENNSFFH